MAEDMLNHSDREVIEGAIECLQKNQRVVLVTVIKTWGASPRPVGSIMLISDAVCCGSVSGGCVEQDLIERIGKRELGMDDFCVLDYGSDAEEANRLSLPCGGRLELLVERLYSTAPLIAILNSIKSANSIARRVCLNTGEASLHSGNEFNADNGAQDFLYTNEYVQKIFAANWHLLLVGISDLSKYVSQIALMLNYKVTICDPRTDYHTHWSLPGVAFTSLMPDDAVIKYVTNSRCAVITTAHDAKLDDMALVEALASPAFYVGALGSQKNSEHRRVRLLKLEVSPEQVATLHAPVGLPIGSHEAAEIAVSIMAQVTALRHHSKVTI